MADRELAAAPTPPAAEAPGQEPVAAIGRDWQLLWYSPHGIETLSAICERTGVQVGDKLYRHPAPPTYADAEAKGLEKAATAYTSGPWSRFADDLTVIAGGVVVGTFHPETPNRANTNGTPLAEAKANAKLAAASPEMLRTLKMVRPTFEELFPNGAGTACIRAAIASAEGAAAIRSLASPAPKGET